MNVGRITCGLERELWWMLHSIFGDRDPFRDSRNHITFDFTLQYYLKLFFYKKWRVKLCESWFVIPGFFSWSEINFSESDVYFRSLFYPNSNSMLYNFVIITTIIGTYSKLPTNDTLKIRINPCKCFKYIISKKAYRMKRTNSICIQI